MRGARGDGGGGVPKGVVTCESQKFECENANSTTGETWAAGLTPVGRAPLNRVLWKMKKRVHLEKSSSCKSTGNQQQSLVRCSWNLFYIERQTDQLGGKKKKENPLHAYNSHCDSKKVHPKHAEDRERNRR